MTKPYYGELLIALDRLVDAVEDGGCDTPEIESALHDAILLLDRAVRADPGIRRGPGWPAAVDRTAAAPETAADPGQKCPWCDGTGDMLDCDHCGGTGRADPEMIRHDAAAVDRAAVGEPEPLDPETDPAIAEFAAEWGEEVPS